MRLTFDSWYKSIYPRILSKEAYAITEELFKEIEALRLENSKLASQVLDTRIENNRLDNMLDPLHEEIKQLKRVLNVKEYGAPSCLEEMYIARTQEIEDFKEEQISMAQEIFDLKEKLAESYETFKHTRAHLEQIQEEHQIMREALFKIVSIGNQIPLENYPLVPNLVGLMEALIGTANAGYNLDQEVLNPS